MKKLQNYQSRKSYLISIIILKNLAKMNLLFLEKQVQKKFYGEELKFILLGFIKLRILLLLL